MLCRSCTRTRGPCPRARRTRTGTWALWVWTAPMGQSAWSASRLGGAAGQARALRRAPPSARPRWTAGTARVSLARRPACTRVWTARPAARRAPRLSASLGRAAETLALCRIPVPRRARCSLLSAPSCVRHRAPGSCRQRLAPCRSGTPRTGQSPTTGSCSITRASRWTPVASPRGWAATAHPAPGAMGSPTAARGYATAGGRSRTARRRATQQS